jgi:hypothetical protein
MRQRDRRDYCEPLFGCLKHFLSEPSLLIGGALMLLSQVCREAKDPQQGENCFSVKSSPETLPQAPLLHRVSTFGGGRGGPGPLLAAMAKTLKNGS